MKAKWYINEADENIFAPFYFTSRSHGFLMFVITEVILCGSHPV